MFAHPRFCAFRKSELRCRAIRPLMWMPVGLILNPPSVIGRLSARKICHLFSNVSSRSPSCLAYSASASLAASFDLKSITQSSMYRQYRSTFR